MVILQFNKLIRNKWIWGAFAIVISAAFAFDFLLDDIRGDSSDGRNDGAAGTLAGEAVDSKLFADIAEDVRGVGNNRDWKTDQSEVNRIAWENYAMLKVAGKNGIAASDEDVSRMIRGERSFQANGVFSFQLYQRLLRENSMTPERFEASLKRRLTMMQLGQSLLASAAWTSPMELDQAVADMTDTFTVKVAKFAQDKKDADAVTLDDAGLKKWYEDNRKSLELPERIKVRYVRFDANDAAMLAKMTVSTNDVRDRFDVTADKYMTKDTNGVETARSFEQLTEAEKDEIEKDLRRIALVQCYETNLNSRAYSVKAAKGSSRLDEIAREEGLKVMTSGWFSTEGGYREGFMQRIEMMFPGAQGFEEAVAELDPQSEDLRYGIVSSEKAVWLIEKAEVSAKHTPTFDEAKEIVRPRALAAAKADAFKAQVEKIAKAGTNAVLAVKDVSTNIVFTVADLGAASFPNQNDIARAAMPLKPGEVSEFTLTRPGQAILVVCEARTAADAAKKSLLRDTVARELAMLQNRQVPDAWRKWNLDRLGFVTGEISSVEKAEVEE